MRKAYSRPGKQILRFSVLGCRTVKSAVPHAVMMHSARQPRYPNNNCALAIHEEPGQRSALADFLYGSWSTMMSSLIPRTSRSPQAGHKPEMDLRLRGKKRSLKAQAAILFHSPRLGTAPRSRRSPACLTNNRRVVSKIAKVSFGPPANLDRPACFLLAKLRFLESAEH